MWRSLNAMLAEALKHAGRNVSTAGCELDVVRRIVRCRIGKFGVDMTLIAPTAARAASR